MKKFIFLVVGILFLFFLFGCTPATKDSIIGSWEQTHVLGFPASIGYFYKFNNDNTYQDGINRTDLNLISSSTYSMSGNSLQMGLVTYDVYILGDVMYWYQSNIEKLRFKKL